MRASSRLILCILLLVITGCEDPEPRLSPLPANARILAFGDSLTFGTGARTAESYPVVLEGLIARKVIRSGIPGEISAQGRKRLPQELQRYKPQLVILCHGGNDILRLMDRGQTKANLLAMIDHIRQSGAEVVLIGVPAPGIFGVELASFYKDLAKETAIPLEGEILTEIVSDKSLLSDSVHPNANGYRRFAEAIERLLRKSGAL